MNSTIVMDFKRKGGKSIQIYLGYVAVRYALIKKKFHIALGCMAARTQSELIRRVHVLRKLKEATFEVAYAGND